MIDHDDHDGLCPDHDRGYVHIAGDQYRRIVRRFGYEPGEWMSLDAASPGDGIYCRACLARATRDGSLATPIDPDLAAAVLGRIVDERPMRSHDHRRSVDDLADAISGVTLTRVDRSGTTPSRVDPPSTITEPLASAIRRAYPAGLYPHQVAAIELAAAGHDVIQTTSTSSGKTLGFLTPVIDRMLRDAGSRAIVMTPLNVLPTQLIDTIGRLGTVTELGHGMFEIDIADTGRRLTVAIFNGAYRDQKVRTRIPTHADLVITNHYMAHDHFLGGDERWKPFLASVRTVVIDEIDRNRGGAAAEQRGVTVALLAAITHLSGRRPQFLTASATVANPVDVHTDFGGHGEVRVVDGAVAHAHDRITVVVDGTAPDADLHAIVVDLVVTMNLARPSSPPATLVFGRSKDGNERLVRMIRSGLGASGLGVPSDATVPYHSEITSEDRRTTERQIRSGAVRTIVATSALEAGADIDQISVCILAGLPDTPAEIRQRIGRAGRKGPALVIIIADDTPLGRSLLAADDPGDVLDIASPHVVVTTSTPTDIRVMIEPLARLFGRVPADIVATLPPATIDAAVESGRFELDDGALVPIVDLSSWDRLASGSEKYEIIGFGNQIVGTLTGARAARYGFVGAELDLKGRPHRVIKTGFQKLYVKPIPEPTGVTATTRVVLGPVAPVDDMLVGGAKIRLGISDPTLHVFPSIPTRRQVRHCWADAGTAHITPRAGVSAPELAAAISDGLWRIGVSPFDIEIRVSGAEVVLIDLDRAGRMSWHVAEYLDTIAPEPRPCTRKRAA